MVAFADWLMPVQYTSIVEEHHAVRNNVGIFDISHMGQFIVEGVGAVAIQGPHTMALFHELFGKHVELPARNHICNVRFNTMNVLVARTGYTGEDGIEVFFPASNAVEFWNAALERGKPLGIKTC